MAAYLSSSRHTLLAVCITDKIKNIARQTNFSNYSARKTKFISLDDGEDDQYNGDGFVEIFTTFAT